MRSNGSHALPGKGCGPALAVIGARLPFLWELGERLAPAGSWLELAAGWRRGVVIPAEADPTWEGIARRAWQGLHALLEGWSGADDTWAGPAVALAGLGHGLTPAGDDFLCGAMAWAWLAHPEPEAFCQPLVRAAAPRTTALSAAWLRTAAAGEFSAPWHRLLGALANEQGHPAEIEAAVREALAHGATSGADILAGLLALHSAPGMDPDKRE